MRRGRSALGIVTRQTAIKAVRSGMLWGYVFGLSVASSALGYASSYKTPAQRAHLAALFGSNAGLNAINGPAHELQTVGGFTVWKCFGFLTILGAAWGLLTATRLLRGEEEAGRWELLLAGPVTRRGAATQGLVGLVAGLTSLWIVVAIVTIVVGRLAKVHIGAQSALFFALALVSGATVFMFVGAFASQLAATRRQAATYAGAALGACYALRMVADSGSGLEWLRWATPLGWIEQLQPLTAPDPGALVPIFGLVIVLAGLTIHLAGQRDLGGSTLPDRSTAPPHTRLLSGSGRLTVRLLRPAVTGWAAAIATMALLLGFIAKEGGKALSSSSSVERFVTHLGASGASADAYLGVTFLILAVLIGSMAASQVAAIRSEEADGRLDHLLVRSISRWSWLAGRLVVAAVVIAAAGALAGVFAWFGAATQHAGVKLTSVVVAGLNVVPPALCIVGFGVLVMGLWPRATSLATYGLLGWSLIIELIGGVGSDHWLLDTSVFHQMAAAPAVNPNWASAGVMVAIGIATAIIGATVFARRDLTGT